MTDLLIRREVLSKLDGIRKTSNGYEARCPMPDHNDSNPSLCIGVGRDQPVVMYCQGCGAKAPEISEAAGIDWEKVSNRRQQNPDDRWAWMPCVKRDGHTWQTNYLYQDARGTPVFGVARCTVKCFAQFRIDDSTDMGRRWGISLPDGTKVGADLLYRLPDLLDSDANRNVYLVGGEKDANRLWRMGTPATCNAGGERNWSRQHAEWLIGRDVIIVADRDPTGWTFAERASNSLLDLARSIEVVRAAQGKDVSDHLDAGHTLAKLLTVAEPLAPPAIGPDGADLPRAAEVAAA